MIPELSEAERQEWESMKYSSRVAAVYMLETGRVIVCQGGLTILGVARSPAEFCELLHDVSMSPLEEYRPPRQRLEERTAQITEGLLSGLSLKI